MQNSNNQSSFTTNLLFGEISRAVFPPKCTSPSVTAGNNHYNLPVLTYPFGTQDHLDLDNPRVADEIELYYFFHNYWLSPYSLDTSINNVKAFEDSLDEALREAQCHYLMSQKRNSGEPLRYFIFLFETYLYERCNKQFKADLEAKFK